MNLQDYLDEKRLTASAAARQLDMANTTLTRFLRGEYLPSDRLMRRIKTWSNGKVTPTDLRREFAAYQQHREIVAAE
jgi:transcriptional regulator with XRE-family HTH domain